MKKFVLLISIMNAAAVICLAQASGNVGYSQAGGSARARQNERAKRVLGQGDAPPTATSMFIEASVLMNVKADEYVAVFGIAEECAAIPDCGKKLDARIGEFTTELKRMGIGSNDTYVDFAAQNKIYGYAVEGSIAKEKLVGFELKKNIAVHYKDKGLLDQLVIGASRAQIFDLIKVDYIVADQSAIQDRLMEEAMKIINRKTVRYEKLSGIKLLPPAQVYAERPSTYYPTEMYDSYVASESEEISPDYYRQRYTIQSARKSRTFFFNPLGADGFDYVINPVVIEPVVQFTLYLKVKYEIDQTKR
ncbi:MAG: hypothetical protein DMF61_13390 [Blastocatellia bacterium AA13]|nr:MAG: hypothetical protein DMF61_13390 [Blastocatellia bacterium AA13]